jgi:hypothetical protein
LWGHAGEKKLRHRDANRKQERRKQSLPDRRFVLGNDNGTLFLENTNAESWTNGTTLRQRQ